jgi:hypothetical protein
LKEGGNDHGIHASTARIQDSNLALRNASVRRLWRTDATGKPIARAESGPISGIARA